MNTRGRVKEPSSQFKTDSQAVLFLSAAGASFAPDEKSPGRDKTKNNDSELTDSDTDWLFCNHTDGFNEDVLTEPWRHYRITYALHLLWLNVLEYIKQKKMRTI